MSEGGGVDVKSEHEYGDTGVQDCGGVRMGKGQTNAGEAEKSERGKKEDNVQ